MTKNVTVTFLAVIVAMAIIISPLDIENASARTVTDQTIDDQETLVRASSREAIEEYVRLILYIIISRLETQIEAQP